MLATQSLAKLSDLSRTMQDTLLANVGCLCVFQVAGADARALVWELGKDRVSEDDITSLPVHQCYVRATVGKERMPAFSMMVKKPEPGDAGIADRIRTNASSYLMSFDEIAAQQEEGRRRVEEYRKKVKAAKASKGSPPKEQDKTEAPPDTGRRDVRSKHYQSGQGTEQQDGDADAEAARQEHEE